MGRVKIKVGSHGFTVQNTVTLKLREEVLGFALRLVNFSSTYVKGRGHVQTAGATYAASNKERSYFKFHISLLEEFIQYMQTKGYYQLDFDISYKTVSEGKDVEFNMDLGDKSPRDYQAQLRDYIASPGNIKTITLQTGKGKTFTTFLAMEKIGKRTLITMQASYIPQWLSEIVPILGLDEKEDIAMMDGVSGFRKTVMDIKLGKREPKVIFCSVTTMGMFFKNSEQHLGKDYGCTPDELDEILDCGLRVTDEAHQTLHFQMKMALYFNCPKSLYLSATIESDQPFEQRMHAIMFPPNTRMAGVKYDRYIDVEAWFYNINNKKTRWKSPRGSYSHVKYEQSLRKDKKAWDNYFKFIYKALYEKFLVPRKDGMKALIYCAETRTCDELKEYLADKVNGLSIDSYHSKVDKDVLYNTDIVITTLQSAGTAVDIPKLRTVIMTVALGSRKLNIQALGRLRVLKDYVGITPEFIYFVCNDIPKHITYHQSKQINFGQKAKSQVEIPKFINI